MNIMEHSLIEVKKVGATGVNKRGASESFEFRSPLVGY